MRIVSLLPSATEIVYALGLEPVATSHECDYPPEAAEKPAVNRSRVDPDAGSAEINDQVAAAESEGGVYELDLDALREADPDLVLTQGMCDVCAVDGSLVRDAIERLDIGAEVLSTHPHSLEDVLADIERIGEAANRADRASALVAELRERIEAVEAAGSDIGERPRVAVLDWMDPVMVAGHWVPEMVEAIGGAYGMADPGERSRPREWESVLEYDPEVLIAAPCGFELDQTRENVTDLTDRPGWEAVSAVREGQVYAMDGHGYVNRPGPRLVDTLEAFGGLVHPDRFEAPPRSIARPMAEITATRN